LLVYDNVSSPDEIADLLPSAGGSVLITSRFSDWSGWAAEVALDVLSLEEASAFLQSRAGRTDAQGAMALAEALGRLPLALDHAAAYCKRTQLLFADYVAKASSLIAGAPRGVGYPRSVAATFALAIAEAAAQCPTAETLMAFIAQCAPERIPMTLIEGAAEDEMDRMRALTALAEVSLLKHDPFEDDTPAVTVHRLVQAVARARSEANGSAQDARERLAARLVAIYPEDEASKDPHFWPLCGQLTPHLLARREACSDAASDIADWANLLDRAVTYLHSRAAYSQAMAVVRDVLAICEKVLGPEHPLTAESLNNLAFLLHGQGDFAGAQPLYERALAVREKVLGPEHPDTAGSLNNLAVLFREQDNFAAARPLHERALAIREKVLGSEHPSTANSLNNLALVLQAQGDFAAARPLFERALAIWEKVLAAHPNTNRARHNLSRLLLLSDCPTEALTLGETALAAHEKLLGRDHSWTKDSARVTADALDALGRSEEAKALRERYGLTGPENKRPA
jgi:tetratricopeptide (TPR) repeat protein